MDEEVKASSYFHGKFLNVFGNVLTLNRTMILPILFSFPFFQ